MSLCIRKIVVPCTALLHPAYKNNNKTRGGLGGVFNRNVPFHWARGISEISNRNVVEWKATCDYSNRGHLDKVGQLDYRKITIHSEKVSCQS